MTPHEWLAVGAVLAGLLAGLPVCNKLCRIFGASPEVARKSVHVTMGATCACFPWIFFRPAPVWILAGLALTALLILRLIPALRKGIGSSLHGVDRLSYGEILFAPAVALVFHISRDDPMLYVIPVNILAVADAAGAIAGTRWGSRFYLCGTTRKSVEGSIAFLFFAFFCAFLPLWFAGRFSPVHTIGISLILAILAMMAEGISDRGFDNLIIPLGCHFLLRRLLISDDGALLIRLAAATCTLALVTSGSRWSSLSGSALIGAALLGYGCAILADWRFLLPPLAVFLCHLFTTRRHRLKQVFDHRLDAVISYAIASLPWALAVERQWLTSPIALAGLSCAMALQLAMADAATQQHVHTKVRISRAVGKGWLIAGFSGLVWLLPMFRTWYLPVSISCALSPLVCYVMGPYDRRYSATPLPLWMFKGLLSLVGSTPVLLFR